MLHFPNAKINIGLFVTEKRADGYHNIESVFYPLRQLKDALEVVPAAEGEESSLRLSGKKVDGAVDNNLVWKAFELLREDFSDRISPVSIRLLKAIPMGAGLGGGSADAAFMLRLLNKYFELDLSDGTLAAYALQLGSDCPFFIYNTPQLAKGRGELLQPVAPDLDAYSIQLVCPPVHVATATAFANITPRPAPFDLSALPDLPVAEWKDKVYNDFESSVFHTYPVLGQIKQQLYADGALYAAMSGSGSALYGIFEKGKKATIESDAELFYFE